MASESTEASFLLERNQKLISESDYSLDLNEEKLALLSKLLPTLQDSENSKFNQLFQDLLQKQSSLKQDFEEKLERQTHLKLDLVEKNSLLAQKVGKLKEKEEEFSIISSLDRSSSIISDNEIQIQEIQKKIREKEDLRKDLIEAEKEHSKSVLDKKDKKRMLIEKQIFYSEKKRKLEEELHGKKKELNNASQSFRDLETGRLEQTISPKSQFFLDTSSIRRATPAKDSTFLDLSSYPSETPAVSTPPQKQVSDSSKTTTYLLLATCLKAVCESSTTKLECLSPSDSVVLTRCSSGLECDIDSLGDYLSNSTTTPINCNTSDVEIICPTNALTGRFCCKSSNCELEKCEENHCVGYDTGNQCEVDSDCIPEHYCKPNAGNDFGSCTKSFGKGDDCDFDNECASGLGCSRGSCVQLFSLDNGKKSDQDYFCKTQMRNKDNLCDSIEVFVDDKKITNPFECKIGDTCVYKYKESGEKYEEGPCMCDGTTSGTGYCTKHLFHDYELASQLAGYMTYDSSLCSGDDASSFKVEVLYECNSLTDDEFYKVLNFTAVLNNWPLFQSQIIHDCAKDIGLFDPDFQFEESFWLGASLILIVL